MVLSAKKVTFNTLSFDSLEGEQAAIEISATMSAQRCPVERRKDMATPFIIGPQQKGV
ncbi:hypothetical protein PSCICO_48250 [Pseudomonas cichorii]|nr:hypothetical protein PSCICO_48250 [Pseudomonas cichorii]